MNRDAANPTLAVSESGVRDRVADQLLLGMLILAAIGTPTSVWRFVDTGWRVVYLVHICLGVLVCAVGIGRRHVGTPMKAVLICAVPFGVGLAGLCTFGFYSAGIVWITISCMVATIFFPMALVLSIVAVEMFSLVAIGYAFTQSWLTLPVDANAYIHHMTGWLAVLPGSLIGVAMALFGTRAYSDAMRTLLHTVTRQRELIEHQATHDALTGLPSLRLARDRLDMALSHALRDQSKTAVLFIDLDGFKAANDNFGHEAGDHVLRTVAQRLQGAIRSVDTAARQGGDEFIVISSGIGSVDDASVVAHKLVQLIAEPIYFEGRELSIGSSIGVAVIPDHASGSDEALRCADQAMYSVKRTGKNNFAMYTPAPG